MKVHWGDTTDEAMLAALGLGVAIQAMSVTFQFVLLQCLLHCFKI